MKHLSVALIVIALITADFMAEYLELSAKSQHSWAVVDTFALMGAIAWFFCHRDKGQ